MACRYAWCETDDKTHADDISFHIRELGHGMRLTVENDGSLITMWMPDFDEWWIDNPEDVDTEYESVVAMLRDLPDNYRRFREELLNDPLFAEEVAFMQAKDARETEELKSRGLKLRGA